MNKQIQTFIEGNIGVKSPKEWTKKQYPVDSSMQNNFNQLVEEADVVVIFGDYDCDGICATYNLQRGIQEVHPNKRILAVFPDRMRDGYGIATRSIEAVARVIKRVGAKKPLIITCDTGIAEKEKFEHLKKYTKEQDCADFKVIVTDHHNIPDELPDVDLICNPHLKGFAYENYCGAGVTYKLIENMVKSSALTEEKKKRLLTELTIFTGIATVADQVEMKEDNWCLTRKSMAFMKKALKNNTVPNNLQILLNKMDIYHPAQINEGLYGFTLGPLFNANGRLKGMGAKEVFEYLIHPDINVAEGLRFQNELRKNITAQICEEVFPTITTTNTPLWIYIPNSYEGLSGLIAGKLAERFKVPSIVLTDGMEDGMLKGSGRSYGNFNIYEYLKEINENLNCFEKCGGHNDACGLSMKKENYFAMINEHADIITRNLSLSEELDSYFSTTNLSVEDLVAISEELDNEYAPFGQKNERPQFAFLLDRNAMECKTMSEGKHLYTVQDGYKFIHFRHNESELENEDRFFMLGTMSQNVFRNEVKYQFIANKVADLGQIREMDVTLDTDLSCEMELG